MNRKTPVVIAGLNCLSGVTSWADQLRDALADHPRYHPQSLYIGAQPPENADIVTATLEEAHQVICAMAPAIVIPNYVWSLFLTGFEPGVRCIGMCHADSVEQYYRPLSWYEPVIDRFIAVSKECTTRLTEHIPMRTADITTLPYGVQIPRELDRCYESKPLRLIYAGRVTQPQKRVWDFVPLVEQLLRRRVRFSFDIVGAGDEFEPLQQLMRARIPAADVRFHPRALHREMAAKWLSHDVFLQVSDFEGTSVSMLEAMAHGTVPVVTAASSGIDGVIHHRENGFVAPVGDMEAVATILAELAEKPSLLTSAGQAAHRTAHAYSMDQYTSRFVQILDQMAEDPSQFNHHKRYGLFSPKHPLMVLRQKLQQPAETVEPTKPSLKQRFVQRLAGVGFSKMRNRDDRRAA